MITFPPEFVTTRYPGYYWNTATQQLFTIKVTGELRPMKFRPGNYWNKYRAGYQISYQGHRKFLQLSELRKLVSQQIIPASK